MQIWRDGIAVTQFKTRTERALLVYLLLHAGQPLSRRFVATMLWPESNESAALKSLRVVLTRLRKTLYEQTSPTPFIVANRTQMWFDTTAVSEVDVVEFETAVAWLQTVPSAELLTDPEVINCTRRAVATYVGDILTGFDSGSELFDEWVLTRRRELHQHAVWVGALAVQQAEKHVEFEKMEQWARQLLVLEPWHEEAHQWVMQALHAQGQRQAALVYYEQLCQTLDAELGVTPGQRLQAFHLWLTVGEMEKAGTVSKRPQISAQKGNLPVELTPYFGRRKTREQLKQQLKRPNHRLVTLLGQGGVGKTRMALAVARQLGATFVDGVWLVELAEVHTNVLDGDKSGNIIARAIAAAMQIQGNSHNQITELVIAWLRNRQCLILLDNIDDLLEGAAFITTLLQRAPQVKIITTSREPLDCVAETTLLLEGLSIPPFTAAADSWRDYAASQLFVDRARRMLSSFVVTSENWPLIVRLCHQVAGTPLALELAASVLRKVTLEELLLQLADSIGVLATRRRDLPSRHRTMQATLDESWRVLSSEERRTLSRLSSFRKSFSSQAALVVAQATAVSLDGLVTKSLLQRQANGRLTLHPLVRQYAAGRLTQQQVEKVSQQHATYFFHLLAELYPDLFGVQPVEAAQLLEPDIGNIQQAWNWAVKYGDDLALLPVLAGTIRLYEMLEQREAFEQLLTGMQNGLNSGLSTKLKMQLQIRIWLEQARLDTRRGHLVSATKAVKKALQKLSAANDVANSLPNYARAYLFRGDIRQKDGYPLKASADFEAALAFAERCDDMPLLVDCLSRLTFFLTRTTQHNERAVKLARDADDRWLESRALQMLGISEANAGHYEQAYQCFAELLYLNVWLASDHQRKIHIFNNLGRVMHLLGDYERALVQYERGLHLATALNEDSGRAYALVGVSNACRMLGDFERALATAVAAQQLILNKDAKADKVFVLLSLGHAYLSVADYDQALNRFASALDIAEEIGLRMFSILCRAGLIAVFLATGRTETAVVHADLIWQYLQANSLNLTLDPTYIYWQTLRVYTAVADPRAAGLLQRAYDSLQETAVVIEDEHLRYLYLKRVIVNKQLIDHWQQTQGAQVAESQTVPKQMPKKRHLVPTRNNGFSTPQNGLQYLSRRPDTPATISNVRRAKFTLYFNLTDVGGNGLITKADYLQTAKRVSAALQLPPYSPPAQQLQAAYVRYWETIVTADRVGDGSVNLDEWIQHFYKLGQDPLRIEAVVHGRGETIVKLFDADGDGRVSRSEWAKFFQTVGYPSEEYEIAFNKLDQDGSGYLSLEALKRAGTQFFCSDDIDTPGNWIYGDFTKYLDA